MDAGMVGIWKIWSKTGKEFSFLLDLEKILKNNPEIMLNYDVESIQKITTIFLLNVAQIMFVNQ
jgi:hypothetical protein